MKKLDNLQNFDTSQENDVVNQPDEIEAGILETRNKIKTAEAMMSETDVLRYEDELHLLEKKQLLRKMSADLETLTNQVKDIEKRKNDPSEVEAEIHRIEAAKLALEKEVLGGQVEVAVGNIDNQVAQDKKAEIDLSAEITNPEFIKANQEVDTERADVVSEAIAELTEKKRAIEAERKAINTTGKDLAGNVVRDKGEALDQLDKKEAGLINQAEKQKVDYSNLVTDKRARTMASYKDREPLTWKKYNERIKQGSSSKQEPAQVETPAPARRQTRAELALAQEKASIEAEKNLILTTGKDKLGNIVRDKIEALDQLDKRIVGAETRFANKKIEQGMSQKERAAKAKTEYYPTDNSHEEPEQKGWFKKFFAYESWLMGHGDDAAHYDRSSDDRPKSSNRRGANYSYSGYTAPRHDNLLGRSKKDAPKKPGFFSRLFKGKQK